MNHTYKVLKSDIELVCSCIKPGKGIRCSVIGGDFLSVIAYGGTIEKFSPNSVKIAGAYYIRNQFEFRVDVKD